MHLVIIGGSDAEISAALRARELDSSVEISLLLVADYPNFSICDQVGPVAAHLPRRRTAERALALRPLHNAGDAEHRLGHRAAGLTRSGRRTTRSRRSKE
jgi:hypothetical protein